MLCHVWRVRCQIVKRWRGDPDRGVTYGQEMKAQIMIPIKTEALRRYARRYADKKPLVAIPSHIYHSSDARCQTHEGSKTYCRAGHHMA
jgi:hypothetical protein